MENITLTVSKEKVYDAVAEITAYTAVKMPSEEDVYSLISTKESDRTFLDRMWVEACSEVTYRLRRFILNVSQHHEESSDKFITELAVPSSYLYTFTDSINSALHSFFVYYIAAKWFKYTNREAVAYYMLEADKYIDDAIRKINYQQTPRRRKLSPF